MKYTRSIHITHAPSIQKSIPRRMAKMKYKNKNKKLKISRMKRSNNEGIAISSYRTSFVHYHAAINNNQIIQKKVALIFFFWMSMIARWPNGWNSKRRKIKIV